MTSQRSPGTRKRIWSVAVVAGVGSIAVVLGCSEGDLGAGCDALLEAVPGVEVIVHENGFSRSGPSWTAALTQLHAGPRSKAEIAEALTEHRDVFEEAMSEIDSTYRPSFELLYQEATAPIDEPPDPAAQDAVRVVAEWGFAECGVMVT